MVKNIQDVDKILYINLESRTDRKQSVVKELQNIGMVGERFNAVKLPTGPSALGCSMSHLKCLEMAKKNNWSSVLICEDDIIFLDPVLFLKQMNRFLEKKDNWDVVLLAGNNMLPFTPIDDTCIQVHNCLTTTGYIVKKHYYDILIQNYKEGILELMKNPEDKKTYAIDKYWLKLQQKDAWYLITPLSVVQYENHSDIEGKKTNFIKYMLNYNKIMGQSPKAPSEPQVGASEALGRSLRAEP